MACLTTRVTTMAVVRELPKTDKGWQAYLTNVRAPIKRTWLSLGGALEVCLEVSGGKTFQARIRRLGDANARRVPIGSFPAVSVADARRRVDAAKSAAREGQDPSLERRRARAGVEQIRTLNALIDAYLERRKPGLAEKTYKLERDLLKGVLAPALGDRLLSDLTPADFGAVLTGYAARLRRRGRSEGTSANKLLAAARRMFKQARGWGLIIIADPTDGLMRPVKEKPRDRILFDGHVLVAADPSLNETGAIVAAIRADPCPARLEEGTKAALQLVLFLGLRAEECAALEWSATALDRSPPTLAVTRSKTKAGLRTLPLPDEAAALLRRLRGQGKPKGYIFPAVKGAKRADHLHPESLSRAFARLCDRLGIEGVTLHDLRRTALSGLIELGHGEIAGRIAGHAAVGVMGRHYDRSDRLEAMRSALAAWAAAVEAAARRAADPEAGR